MNFTNPFENTQSKLFGDANQFNKHIMLLTATTRSYSKVFSSCQEKHKSASTKDAHNMWMKLTLSVADIVVVVVVVVVVVARDITMFFFVKS